MRWSGEDVRVGAMDLVHMYRRGCSSRLTYRHVEARALYFAQSRLDNPGLESLFPSFGHKALKGECPVYCHEYVMRKRIEKKSGLHH